MTTSRSTGSQSSASRVVARLAWLAALLVSVWILVRPGVAEARRRLVVLEFEGDSAEEFQDELVKFLKKSHSVISLKKWTAAAEDLGATKVTDKNVKKVAKKLSIDGVISGTVEKRGSRYYVRLQLRDGATGKKVAQSELVERSPRFSTDGKATLTDELLAAIDELESAGDDDADAADGGGDDDDRGFGRGKPPRDKVRDRDADADADADRGDDDDRSAARTAKERKAAKEKAAREKAAKEKAARDRALHDRDDADDIEMDDSGGGDDDDDRVAADDDDRRSDRSRGGDDDDVAVHGDAPVEPDDGIADPRTRPVDLSAGLSFTARRLSFNVDPGITGPLGYKSNPVAGLYVAADLYPLAFNKKNRSITRDLGLTVVADRVIKMDSQIEQSGMVYKLSTTQQHLGIGVTFRRLVGAKLTINASIRYNKLKFVIDHGAAAMPDAVDIPNVSYSYLDPGLGARYVLGPKLAAGADVRVLFISDIGAMQSAEQYGGATVKGLDLGARLDYQVGAKLLVRAAVGMTRIGFTFKGTGALSNNRDGDPSTRDVSGASDDYFGGALTGVYAF